MTNIDALLANELRASTGLSASRHLHDGAYAVEIDNRWDALLVFGSGAAVPAVEGRLRNDASHLA